MEFAIDQPLKIYSGGLGFLAGSHMRSAYELKQNLIGIGILWKYGYYDQARNMDGSLKADFVQKDYAFLTDIGVTFTISIHHHPVHVKVWLLKPEVFQTAPIFLLSTDIPQNDHLAQTICHRLYDHHESARIAASILLGVGGAKLIDVLGLDTEIYHMNEGHALPLCFYLLKKFNSDVEEVRRRVVFTTHTPEKAGNEEHPVNTMEVLGFFQDVDQAVVRQMTEPNEKAMSYTLAALRMAKIANGVSALHGEVSRRMWAGLPAAGQFGPQAGLPVEGQFGPQAGLPVEGQFGPQAGFDGICKIISITNAQNKKFWMDSDMEKSLKKNSDIELTLRKKEMKRQIFKMVVNQTGKFFDENVLTIVWARRFAGYKRADLLMRDFERFRKLITNTKTPLQVIWAGKPYPQDHGALHMFNEIFYRSKEFANCAVLVGYEMELSRLLKCGSDVWLNTPRLYREASGTSGMTAAMNGSINLSIADGWIPEFAKDGKNCFIIPSAEDGLDTDTKDSIEATNLYSILENVVIPMYYKKPKDWIKIVKQSMKDVVPFFDSNRMADEYYRKMYNYSKG